MCSFDVSSLFTNVPLDETIKICADALYDNLESQPCIPKEVFVELMHSATSTVEFSFDNIIYRQIDGVAMSFNLAPLWPTSSSGIMKKNYFPKYLNLPFISDTLMTLLPSFERKKTQRNF